MRGLDDIKSLLDGPYYGSVETAAAPFWRLIHQMQPDIKTAVIRRSVAEVVESLMATGIAFDKIKLLSNMRRLDAKLDQIEARVPGVLSVRFDELATEEACAKLVTHCTEQKLAPEWFAQIAPLNLQCDLGAMLRYMQAHQSQLGRIGRLAKQRMLAALSPTKSPDMEGVTFQEECFETMLSDARWLFREHCIEVGEPPENFMQKNLPLLKGLDDQGALQILTARSNGRMFGYLVTIISPSLESQTGIVAQHNLFFASPTFPTLGKKLLSEAIRRLTERGVDELLMRAGPRGSGPRMGAVYKRLGAVEDGQWFKLDLKAA